MVLAFCTCCRPVQKADALIDIDRGNIVSADYIGNGVEWDPYELDYGFGKVKLSDSDWDKLFSRLDYMRPQFVRVMFFTKQYVKDGKFDFDHDSLQVNRMLNYCLKNGITVMIGDWGHGMVDLENRTFDRRLVDDAVRYADYLVNVKGFSCIRYYNLVNEPNGDWSDIKGDYALWEEMMRYFYSRMRECGLDEKVGLVGPDASIWDDSSEWWIDKCSSDLAGIVKLYDIHTYPSISTVNSGDYSGIIKTYRDRVPEGSRIVIGEIGLKPNPGDSLDAVNRERINRMPYASRNDSQTLVFDHFYGVDLVDALIQAMNCGFSGASVWMLDDAMHSNPDDGAGKLKIWGFWNILGEEYFGGAEQEKVRPPYYAWSLMTRYIPKGSAILTVKVEGKPGIRAVAAKCGDAYTIGIVNSSKNDVRVAIRSEGLRLEGMREYDYAEGKVIRKGDCMQLANGENLTLDLDRGFSVKLPKDALIVYTNLQID
ncbi:MAG: cellulase family glycosylhydrolase [Bacteroidales bacterium]|jgi:hypothetical protein|nr:cellulase family glycosylhydrolase [Bacteroidales bacterium]MCI2121668.1 cellulase family glycosylhydrolase [Bacteroidales bacterium]MCI2144633.1 cellulase family glycosylhydrolase [Bacteroidales bacterium]